MSNQDLGKKQSRRKKWKIDKVQMTKEKLENDKEEILIDELAELFYTYAVNQTSNVPSTLSKQVSTNELEAA